MRSNRNRIDSLAMFICFLTAAVLGAQTNTFKDDGPDNADPGQAWIDLSVENPDTRIIGVDSELPSPSVDADLIPFCKWCEELGPLYNNPKVVPSDAETPPEQTKNKKSVATVEDRCLFGETLREKVCPVKYNDISDNRLSNPPRKKQ